MGYNGGIEGLIKRRSDQKIQKIDEETKNTIQESFSSYQAAAQQQHSTKTQSGEKDEKNLQYLLGDRVKPEFKPLFDINIPLLTESIATHSEVTQFDPSALASLGKRGQEFIKQEQQEEGGKIVSKYILDPEKIDELEKNKYKIISEYIKYSGKELPKQESYLKSLQEPNDLSEGSPKDKLLFTTIGGLFIPQKTIMNGVQHETFLPEHLEAKVTTEKAIQTKAQIKSEEALQAELTAKEGIKAEANLKDTITNLENRATNLESKETTTTTEKTESTPHIPTSTEIGEKSFANIKFAYNQAIISSESEKIIQEMADWLQAHPEINIEIGGHTDNLGTLEDNKKISEMRAKAVYQKLISLGIAKNRLSYKGYGKSQPLVPNDSPSNREKNRRTEFKIKE